MLNKFRRKLADAISPEPVQSYPFMQVKWKSDVDEKREGLVRARALFKEENGVEARTDDEALDFAHDYSEKAIARIMATENAKKA